MSDAGVCVVLDTHVLVWLVDGDSRPSKHARLLVEHASRHAQVWISAITPWEIAVLLAGGRLVLARDVQEWIDDALALPGIRLAPLGPAIAVASTRLPGALHGDPADRIIAATARHLGALLLTADAKLLGYGSAGHLRADPAV